MITYTLYIINCHALLPTTVCIFVVLYNILSLHFLEVPKQRARCSSKNAFFEITAEANWFFVGFSNVDMFRTLEKSTKNQFASAVILLRSFSQLRLLMNKHQATWNDIDIWQKIVELASKFIEFTYRDWLYTRYTTLSSRNMCIKYILTPVIMSETQNAFTIIEPLFASRSSHEGVGSRIP